jgi:fatty acid desaturase/membrane-associated phospholipid phosphatase
MKNVSSMDLSDLKTNRSTGLINIGLLAVAGVACIVCLRAASQAFPVPLRIIAAVCFSFLANTMFSLMHEGVHGGFHPDKRLNEWGGRIAAAFFPTAFSLQRAFHLSHHRNNRSPIERFDYCSQTDNYFLKVLQWYGILTGVYWATSPLFCAIYALTAQTVPWPRLFKTGNRFGDQTSSRAFLESLKEVPISRMRFDVALSVTIQFLIVRVFDVSLLGWCLCYGFFALNWSSLQYADHAFSSLDRHEGAWNLKVNGIVRLLFLNYHYHLAHHRSPSVGWMNLPKVVKPEDPQLSYWRVLLCMWAGPRALPDVERESTKEVSGHKGLIVNLMVSLVFTIYFWLLYGSSAVLSQLAPVVHRVDFAFEQAIPFVPWASLVYLTVMPFLALAPFVLKTPERLLPLVATLALQVLIAWWVYLIFPVQVSFPPHAVAGAVGALYSLAVALALVGNALPSLHVALSVSVAWCYAAGKTKLIRFACWGWALSISVSTVLTHQHNVLDVAAGAMLAFMTMGFVYPCLQDSLGGDLKRLFSREGVMVS